MYCTAADVANTATGGWEELAQRASPTGAGVDAELLQAALDDEPLAAWPPEAQALAAQAVARVADAIATAGRHIDTYLFPKYRSAMPLAPEVIAASSLPAVCAAIALRRLYGASVPEEVRKGTAWADAYLVDISKGVVSLGQADASTDVAQPAGRTVARSAPRTFTFNGY
jgi:phage gp36-like protein